MSATCLHGFPASECLICRALGTQPRVEVESYKGSAAAHPDAVYPPGSPARHPRNLAGHVVLIVAGLVAIGVAAWIVAGVVFALLHILELVAVAGVAGWAGYRLGHYRGRHQGP